MARMGKEKKLKTLNKHTSRFRLKLRRYVEELSLYKGSHLLICSLEVSISFSKTIQLLFPRLKNDSQNIFFNLKKIVLSYLISPIANTGFDQYDVRSTVRAFIQL